MAEMVRWTYEVASELAKECNTTENALHDLASALSRTVEAFAGATDGDTTQYILSEYESFKPVIDQKLPEYLSYLNDYINRKNAAFQAADS